jgi:hypothetical protein
LVVVAGVAATLKDGSHQPMHRAWAWTFWECEMDLPGGGAESADVEVIICIVRAMSGFG